MKAKFVWALIPLALLGTTAVQAEGVRQYGADEVPKAEDIADILRGSSATPSRPRMRGISLDPAYQKPAPAPAPAPAPQIAAPAPAPAAPTAAYVAPAPTYAAAAPAPAPEKAKQSAFSLPVNFAFNSFRILPEAEPQLDAVAQGIKLVPGARVVVEGHTDAYGSYQVNARLSRKRAESVKTYMVRRHGINPSSLIVEGRGEESPINAADPYAPENRRVQFRAAQ